ncbi:MAG: TerB family tellurite resistance protein [Ekhidna sp.]|nr:TerB family tellurite resistance protein [Ekhidna sp.]
MKTGIQNTALHGSPFPMELRKGANRFKIDYRVDQEFKFKALVGIAQSDGEFDKSEKQFIKRIADLEGISSNQLKDLLQHKSKARELAEELTFDQKVDILVYVVKLMKVDGKVVLSEIKYCEKIAGILGFEDKAIGFLSGIIESNPDATTNLGRINHRMRKYLIES